MIETRWFRCGEGREWLSSSDPDLAGNYGFRCSEHDWDDVVPRDRTAPHPT